jgi:cytochrome P450
MFFVAMIHNPKAMRKAQEELDRVVGKGELPDFSHKDDLPYIDALIKEVIRWSPPLPLSVPKRVTQDDVYRGYFIPEGAIVVENVWGLLRDPNVYPDPEAFNPDRFLKDGKINPLVFNPEDRAFGAGRR